MSAHDIFFSAITLFAHLLFNGLDRLLGLDLGGWLGCRWVLTEDCIEGPLSNIQLALGVLESGDGQFNLLLCVPGALPRNLHDVKGRSGRLGDSGLGRGALLAILFHGPKDRLVVQDLLNLDDRLGWRVGGVPLLASLDEGRPESQFLGVKFIIRGRAPRGPLVPSDGSGPAVDGVYDLTDPTRGPGRDDLALFRDPVTVYRTALDAALEDGRGRAPASDDGANVCHLYSTMGPRESWHVQDTNFSAQYI